MNIDVAETGLDGVGWIRLAQYRDQQQALVNTVINFRISYNGVIFFGICATIVSSRKTQLHELGWPAGRTFGPSSKMVKKLTKEV
jgi:hypothetical protein